MKDLSKVIYDIRRIDDLSREHTIINSINSSVKIIITFIYIIKILSMKYFSILDTIVVVLYPILIFFAGKVSVKSIFKKVLFVIPVILGISVVNLIINFSYYEIYFSILLLFKCAMALTGSLLLIATTGMEGLALGLSKLKVPRILINQLTLLYRYIILMIEECYKIKCAYELRTYGEKSMNIRDFGKIMGHLLLRSIDRAENVYAAMNLRGFSDDLYYKDNEKFTTIDGIVLLISSMVLIII